MLICMSGSSPGLYLLFIPWYNLTAAFFSSFEPLSLSLLWGVLSLLGESRRKRKQAKRRERKEIVVLHLITHHRIYKSQIHVTQICLNASLDLGLKPCKYRFHCLMASVCIPHSAVTCYACFTWPSMANSPGHLTIDFRAVNGHLPSRSFPVSTSVHWCNWSAPYVRTPGHITDWPECHHLCNLILLTTLKSVDRNASFLYNASCVFDCQLCWL